MQNQDQLGEYLETIALESVDLEPDSISSMGKILNTLSVITNTFHKDLPPMFLDLIKGLENYVEQMSLGEVHDPDPVKNAASCMQGLYRSLVRGEKINLKEVEQVLILLGSNGEIQQELPQSAGQNHKSCKGPEQPSSGDQRQDAAYQELSDEDIELLQDFVSEALDSLSTIEVKIIDLEQNPEDGEIINSIFRPFHTIKGVSGFLNLGKINKLAHCSENLLDKARAGEINIDGNIADIILESVDILKQLIEAVQQGMKTGATLEGDISIDAIVNKIQGLIDKSEKIGDKPLGEILVQSGALSPEDMDKALEEQKKEPGKKLGQVLIEKGAVKPRAVASALREQKSFKGNKKSDLQVKVDTRKLDTLVDMTGELVIAQSMLRQNDAIVSSSDQKLFQTMSQLNQITSTLQKAAMSMRMVPIKHTFQKMVRLVRDLAKTSGKEVTLTMSGEDTEIDRNVVDELYEPMVHMVRNAVDHGIELPDERVAQGKPAHGTLELRAYHQSGNIVIEIKDDGRGLDKDSILEKAREKGLIDQAATLTDAEVYNLIFHPGFSTAKKITEISGRGVGMDVVKKGIEKLRGRVEISTNPGRGSTFTIHLPLTLAIIDGMVVRIGKERYIIPTLSILESLKPDKGKYSSVHGRGELIKVRDSLIPLVRFETVFNVQTDTRDPWDGLVVAVEHDGRRFCLLVDEVIGKEEVVIKNLGSAIMQVKGLAGGAILGDGRVALILDIGGISELASIAT